MHLRFDKDSLIVELPKSKTNQKGEAEEKAISSSPTGVAARCGP
jgi:hypothetical protein